MEFNTGELISFVLTIFSIVITIIPIIAPPSGDTNLSSSAILSRAVTNIVEHRSGSTGLFAHNLLHDNTPKNLVFRPNDTSETNLARAVIHYNDDNLSTMRDIWKHVGDQTSSSKHPIKPFSNCNGKFLRGKVNILCDEIWFANRTLNLEEQGKNNKIDKEDPLICSTPSGKSSGKCTSEQLRNITDIRSSLAQNGFIDNFYNDENKVHSVQKPVETFVSDLHTFIIVSLVSGPIVVWVGFRHYVRLSEK